MRIHYRAAAVALASLSVQYTAHAADAAMPSVVVTATRQPLRSNELLSDTVVVTREDIERAAPLQTLGDLLRTEGGIESTSRGGPGSPVGIFIRGANAGHTLLLVDGMRIGSATLGEPTISAIPLAQIERIEVLKGPASSLYGADAIGGVIQVFTRRGEGPARISASAAAGSYDTREFNAGISGAGDAIRYSASVGTTDSGGFNATSSRSNAAYNGDRDGYDNISASGRLSVTPAAGHEIEFQGLHSKNRRHYDSIYYDAFFNPRADFDFHATTVVNSFATAMRNRITDNWTSQVRVGRSEDNYTDRDAPDSRSEFRTKQDQLMWQNDVRIPFGSLLLAAESLRQKIDSTGTYVVRKRIINSLLAGWTGDFGDHRLQLNLRNDRNSQFGHKTTGGIAYGYQFNDRWRLRTSFATAFKAPTFNDLYFPDDPLFGGGNPNLQPESARNREIGVNYEAAGTTAALSLYRNDVNNLIDWQPDDPSNPWSPWHPTNVGTARLEGLSATARQVVGAFTLRASADLQNHRDLDTGKQLVLRARRHGSLGFDHRHGDLTWGATLSASGSRYNDAANTQKLGGYATLGLRADYRLDRNTTLFARAGNVFDRDYELRRDYASGGRNLFVGIRYVPE